jgi:hypothetical protein
LDVEESEEGVPLRVEMWGGSPGHFHATPSWYPVPGSRTEDSRAFVRVNIPRWRQSVDCLPIPGGIASRFPSASVKRSSCFHGWRTPELLKEGRVLSIPDGAPVDV